MYCYSEVSATHSLSKESDSHLQIYQISLTPAQTLIASSVILTSQIYQFASFFVCVLFAPLLSGLWSLVRLKQDIERHHIELCSDLFFQ